MLKQRARVVAVEEDGLWVEARRHNACQQCASRTSCGQSPDSGRLSLLRIPAADGNPPAPGATISLQVADSLVLKLSLLFYVMPLAALLAGSLFAARFADGEAAAMLGAAGGLVAGIAAARQLGRRLEARPDFRARIQEEAAASPGSSLTHETES